VKKISKEAAIALVRENAKKGYDPFVTRAANQAVSDGEAPAFYEGFCSGLALALQTIEQDAGNPDEMKYYLGEVLAQAAWLFLGDQPALSEELEKYL